jgi:hypothetical protein
LKLCPSSVDSLVTANAPFYPGVIDCVILPG